MSSVFSFLLKKENCVLSERKYLQSGEIVAFLSFASFLKTPCIASLRNVDVDFAQ